MSNWNLLWWGIGYVLGFVGITVGLIKWRVAGRKERQPFRSGDRLLRGPGESLWQGIAELDENLVYVLLAALVTPLVGGGALVLLTAQLSKAWVLPGLGASLLAILLAMILGANWIVGQLEKRWRYYLGYFGERYVAEHLDPLKAEGFRVFHDVPCGEADSPFNVDHVVVGPTGVWAIETKTRRKGRARPGFKDAEVVFDGTQLIFPWAEDRHGLDQALQRALWLEKWLERLLGKGVAVQPVLTFPGWFVVERAPGPVRVLNPKLIPAAIRGRGEAVLTPPQVDLLARQLDQRCRNVEF